VSRPVCSRPGCGETLTDYEATELAADLAAETPPWKPLCTPCLRLC
jgi:hypothetical protein